MKLSELITNLQGQLDQHGDMVVNVSVSDYYTDYSSRADILEATPNWNPTTFANADGTLSIRANLQKDTTGANPKITFRK
jgi:hypothetical protein